MTKYYVGTIEEVNGEREYRCHVFFMLKDHEEPHIALDKIAETWYGDNGELIDDCYWFNDVTVYAGDLKEISHEVYDVMHSFQESMMNDKHFKETIYELAFGCSAIDKDYSDDEVIAMIREFSDKALAFDQAGLDINDALDSDYCPNQENNDD